MVFDPFPAISSEKNYLVETLVMEPVDEDLQKRFTLD